MKAQELGHIVLYVRDIGRSREFYGDVLGFDEIPGTPPGLAMFRGANARTHHELFLIEVGDDATALPAGRHVGLYHFGVKVGESDDDLRDALRRLQEANAVIIGASDHTVTHSLYIEDPDGHEIELYIDVQPEIWRNDPSAILAPIKPLNLVNA